MESIRGKHVARRSKLHPRKRDDALEDWDLFVLRHQNSLNIVAHIVSFFLFWGSPIFAILFSPWWLVGFFISGFVGTAGHYTFNDGVVDFKEATSSWKVVYFSSAMIFLFLQNRYATEIQISSTKYTLFLENKLQSVADPSLFFKLPESYKGII